MTPRSAATATTTTTVGEAAQPSDRHGGHEESEMGHLEDERKTAYVSERAHGAGCSRQGDDVLSIRRAIESTVRAHPYRTMLMGLGAGYLFGRLRRR